MMGSGLKTPRIRDLRGLSDQEFDLGLALLSPVSGFKVNAFDLGKEILKL